MWSLYKLQFKTNIKSPSMIMPIFFPLIMIILFSVNIETSDQLAIAFGSLLGIIVMQSGLIGFGFNFLEIKDSVLLRRISATKISKWEVLIAVIFWGMTVMALTVIWLFFMVEFFSLVGFFQSDIDGEKVVMSWSTINWSGMLVAVIFGIILTYPLGFFFVILSKDINSFETKIFIYFFFASFLSGLMLPNSNIPWFDWVGYFVPSVWNTHMIADASQGANVLNLSGYTTLDGTDVQAWEASLNFALPVILGVGIFALDIKMFKWTD